MDETEYAYTEYETDYATEAPLPTPGDTPYRTPHLSRRTSRNPSSSPTPSQERRPSPNRRFNDSLAPEDEQYHEFDPRRFTPSLHANLVAEILTLRREVESKVAVIDSLENSIYDLQAEQENTHTQAATAEKEARDAKRLLARAANDDGVAAVAAERDEAVEALVEVKKQMERLAVSRRKAQEDLERIKKIQERDLEKFEDAKRAFERRAHVAEGRLKAVLDELAAEEEKRCAVMSGGEEVVGETASPRGSVMMSPDHRPMSMESMMSRRPMSMEMGDDEAERLGMSLAQGLSLAAELSFNNDSGSELGSGDESDRDSDRESYRDSAPDSGAEDTDDDRLDEELDNLEDNASQPGDLVSDHESVGDELDELDELPELVDMGVQVGTSEEDDRVLILEAQLEDRETEVTRLYGFLDQKNADIEALYIEIDAVNTRASEAEDKLSAMESAAFAKNKEYDEKTVRLDNKIVAYEQRREEVEQRWILMDQKSKKMIETEKGYSTRDRTLNQRDKSLKEWQEAIDEQDVALADKEEVINQREAVIKEKEIALQNDQQLLLASTVHVPDDVSGDLDDGSIATPPLSNYEQKSIETEFEANIRQKHMAGTVTPPEAEAETPKFAAPEYATAEVQTEMPVPPPKCVTACIQTVVEPSPSPAPAVSKVYMMTSGTQTDVLKPRPSPIMHIPGIMITPPPPTPPLPAPKMKDASVQTITTRTRTHSMQTEGIRLDERLKNLAPHLRPSILLPPKDSGTTTASDSPVDSAPSLPRRSSKRTTRRTSVASQAPTSVPESPSSRPAMKQTAGNGSPIVYTDEIKERKRDVLPRNLFDLSAALTNSSGDEDFGSNEPELDLSGNEYTTALTTAPRARKPRISAFGPDFPAEGGLSRRQDSMRKNALVSSGVQAHSSTRNLARSPSIVSDRTNKTGSTSKQPGPPFPVPARNSSRRPAYLSDRERNQSPTPKVRGSGKGRLTRQKSVRKVRSAAELPEAVGRSTPPPSTSTAPDSPELSMPPPLPKDNINSPFFDRNRMGHSRHRQQPSNNTQSTTGDTSVGSAVQQTSVVDAIAQTMVGEWMWKYVRRRKSFGVSAEASPAGDDSAGGTRHRRWVWLAPYERAVMWSSRQPTSGPALLGKSGRKLLIQSVLDVKDDTPMPKGATPAQPVFNRSILILTPARALKFTAPNRERHYVWLTALSFLSHSPEGTEGHLALPPPMPFEYEQMEKQVQPVHRGPERPKPQHLPPPPPIPAHKAAFSPVRDSVRLAKGRTRVQRQRRQTSIVSEESFSAEPPFIPRYPGHARKRSHSAARLPTRAISNNYENSLASYATTSAGGSVNGDSIFAGGPNSANSSINGSWEAPPAIPSAGTGTVRMTAFVSDSPIAPTRKRYDFDEQDQIRSSQRARRGKSKQEAFFGVAGGFAEEGGFSVGGVGRSDTIRRKSAVGQRGASFDTLEDYDPFGGFEGRGKWN